MPERPRPDPDAVSDALREHDERSAEDQQHEDARERPGAKDAEDDED